MRARTKHLIHSGMAILLVATTVAHAELSVSELWAKSVEAEADGDYSAALEYHGKILPKIGKSYAAALRAGWLHYKNGEYSMALKHYEKAAGFSRGALSPLYGIMNCQVKMNDDARAERTAKAILVIDALNYTANKQLAALYYKEKKFSLAAAYYRKLNRLFPEDLAVASGLAWSYLEQGEARQAAPLFKEILMVSPDYAHAGRGLEICDSLTKR